MPMNIELKQDKNLNTFRSNIKRFKNRVNQVTLSKETCIINNKDKDYQYYQMKLCDCLLGTKVIEYIY